MAILSFYAKKLQALVALSEAHPEHRRPCMEQRYSTEFLRDDLDPARKAELMSGEDPSFSFEIEDDEIDTAKIPSGVWLVGDVGVYIMMNVSMKTPDLVTTPTEHAVQCFETDLRNIDPDDVYQEKERIFGGDDGTMFLDAEWIRAVCKAVAHLPEQDQVVTLDLDDDGLGCLPLKDQKAYLRAMRAVDADFFDPDKKAAPVLWRSPEIAAEPENPGM